MRVIAGKARGLTLKTLSGDSTRPTRDMVREALFSILMNRIQDCVFLDLFAGSGAVGIEALSIGARKVIFCDASKASIDIIKANVEKAKFTEQSEVLYGDYLTLLGRLKNEKFDIAFIDPPYNKGMGTLAIEKISKESLLNNDGIIVYETDKVELIPDKIGEYERINYKKY